LVSGVRGDNEQGDKESTRESKQAKAREKTREHTSFHTSGGGDNWIVFRRATEQVFIQNSYVAGDTESKNIKKNKVTDGS
jgi:hypothetical protein